MQGETLRLEEYCLLRAAMAAERFTQLKALDKPWTCSTNALGLCASVSHRAQHRRV